MTEVTDMNNLHLRNISFYSQLRSLNTFIPTFFSWRHHFSLPLAFFSLLSPFHLTFAPSCPQLLLSCFACSLFLSRLSLSSPPPLIFVRQFTSSQPSSYCLKSSSLLFAFLLSVIRSPVPFHCFTSLPESLLLISLCACTVPQTL